MASRSEPKKARLGALVAVAVVHMLLGYILVTGLYVEIVREVREALNLVELSEQEESREAESAVAPNPEEEGAAGAPADEAAAARVVDPEPEIQLERRSRMETAPDTADSFDDTQGVVESATPGRGADGEGDDTGTGLRGGGDGGGAVEIPARRIEGDITPDDYPPEASEEGAEGTVGANISIGRDGRVTGCEVARSSGNAALDSTTCRLIQERFRYEPARDANGNPVPDATGREQRWWLGRE